MKIFISHSSKDKWIAGIIASRLMEIGASVFLDEKDIKTGGSINTQIQEHLSKPGELLILLSPASIKSQWVLIELGGAIALKKNIIPIYLHVGLNEIPTLIRDRKGRDINDIERYFKEVESRLLGKDIDVVSTEKKEPKETKFSVGDKVQLPKKPQPEDTSVGWVTPEMDEFLGLQTSITDINTDGNGTLFAKVRIDDGVWWWDLSWLVKIE